MLSMDLDAIADFVGGATVITPTEVLPTDAEIAALGQRIGVKFPDDYVMFLRSCGSLLVQVRPELWPPPEPGNIAPHWMQTRFALRVFGLCAEVAWMRIEPETATFRAETHTQLAPVFQWPNVPDATCFAPDGRLVHWTPDGTHALTDTFAEHLERLLVEQRTYRDRLRPRESRHDPVTG